MDVAAVRAHDRNPIMCSSCEDKLPAAARCIECMDFLCHDCRNAHTRLRLTKTHRVSVWCGSSISSKMLHEKFPLMDHLQCMPSNVVQAALFEAKVTAPFTLRCYAKACRVRWRGA